MQPVYDLLIIGGGINGVGVARDAAGRGLSVLLVEQDDLAAHTSSLSTKLIHGGLRYLEYGEFRLVREALREREQLLAIAPHLIQTVRFVLPHDPAIRPAWLVRLGLFLYDHLAPRGRLEHSQRLRLLTDPRGAPLKPVSSIGFEYSDCTVDDSRLVVLNALDARERGADIRVGVRLESARREDGHWLATLADTATGRKEEAQARILVNAAGPWVVETLNRRLGLDAGKNMRLVKGSHIVTPRLYEGEHAYLLQNPDKRVVFAIPYQGRFTLIGSTETPHNGPPGDVAISPDETLYLIDTINRWFKRQLTPSEIVWSYAGIRPLFDDGSIQASAVTRDYAFDLDARGGGAPLLSVFGGKLTTYRKLAEHAMRDLSPFLPGMKQSSWTGGAPLPGGDFPGGDVARFIDELLLEKPFLGRPLASRLARAYGARVSRFIGPATSMGDLGRDLGAGLTEAELDYLVRAEWARRAEDVLWRRSKLGLHLPKSAATDIDAILRGPAQTHGARSL